MLCSVVLCCCVLLLLSLRASVGYWSFYVCRVRRPCAVLLAGCLQIQVVTSRWISGARDNLFFFLSVPPLFPLSHALLCRFKTSPCGRSKRPRVDPHHAHMCFNMCAWCRYTRGRFERTHWHVLSGHTGFSACHTTPRTDTTTTTTATTAP